MTIKPTKSGLSGKGLTQHPQTRFVEKMGLFYWTFLSKTIKFISCSKRFTSSNMYMNIQIFKSHPEIFQKLSNACLSFFIFVTSLLLLY